MPTLPPLTVIGVVRTARRAPADTPVQSALNPDEEGVVELDPVFAPGLDGLAGFDHLWLVTWLGPAEPGRAPGEPPPLLQVPFLRRPDPRTVGVFATRGPRRVNPLGLSLVRVVAVEVALIRFAGVDLVDGTPVIDLKPYVAAFDRPAAPGRSGWFDETPLPAGATPASLAEAARRVTGSPGGAGPR